MAWLFKLVLALFLFNDYASGTINFMILGDWGADPYLVKSTEILDDPELMPFGVDDQVRVRDQMDVWAGQFGSDFIITVGDNFYPDGVVSLTDPRWDDAWRNVYNTTNLVNLQWRPTLGNHDHVFDGRYMYQVNMTDYDNHWYLPNNYHDYYVEKDGIKIHFIALDTELITFNQFDDREVQLAWFNQTLENHQTDSDWLIVYAHHNVRTCGRYGPGNFVLQRDILPQMMSYGVDFYLNGHDHNLQHITKNDTTGPEFVVTGSGGKGRYELDLFRCIEVHEDGYTLEFFAERYGFVGAIFDKTSVTFNYYGDMGTGGQLEQLYSFTSNKVSHDEFDF